MLKTSAVALLCLSLVATPAAALELEDCRITAGPGYPGIKEYVQQAQGRADMGTVSKLVKAKLAG